jgi:hypothetical protein
VIAGAALFAKDLKFFQMVKTLEGDSVKIVSAGHAIVNKAMVITADVAATNGVLLPPAASCVNAFRVFVTFVSIYMSSYCGIKSKPNEL